MDEEMEIWKSIFYETLLTDKKIRAVEVGTGPGISFVQLALAPPKLPLQSHLYKVALSAVSERLPRVHELAETPH